LQLLEQAQRESQEPPPASYAPPPTTLMPQPETQPPRGETEMAAPAKAAPKKEPKAKLTKLYRPQTLIDSIVAEVLAAGPRIPGSRDGTITRIAEKHNIPNGMVGAWLKKHGKRVAKAMKQSNGAASESRTLMSTPSAPVSSPRSAAVSVAGPMPPVPTVTLAGLEDYINAIVDKRLRERLAMSFEG
jgi:hypothetical protein